MRFSDGEIVGYEGLIRGPANTPQESPAALFRQAARESSTAQLEEAAGRVCIDAFGQHDNHGLLFINYSAAGIESFVAATGGLGDFARTNGIEPQRLVVELTEQSTITDAERFGATVRALREKRLAFRARRLRQRLCVDEPLGAARAALREDRPLLRQRHRPRSAQVRSGQGDGVVRERERRAPDRGRHRAGGGPRDRARSRHCCAQGYLLGRPGVLLADRLPDVVARPLRSEQIAVYPARTRADVPGESGAVVLDRMLVHAPALTMRSRNDDVVKLFNQAPSLHALAVVDDGRPLRAHQPPRVHGPVRAAVPSQVFGKRPCMQFANQTPLVVSAARPLEQVARLLTNDEQRYLSDGFIITDQAATPASPRGEAWCAPSPKCAWRRGATPTR